MKILILGNTGFVGNALYQKLKCSSNVIETYSRESGQNLLNYNHFENFLSEFKPDIIINCAAHVGSVHYGLKFPATIFNDNMQMIINIFLAVSKVSSHSKMINLISNCVYPMNADVQIENQLWEGMPHPTALPYASVRRMILVISESYSNQYGIKSINLVLPGIYGPGNHIDIERVHALDGIIIRMIKAYKNKDSEFEIWGTGTPIREWCYIDDLVLLIIKAIDLKIENNEIINLGQNKGYSIKEIALITKKLLNYNNGKIVFNTKYPDGAAVKILDNEKFKKYFRDFTFTSIEHGIDQTLKYLANKI
jgi:GDP-L-fucose synthase